MPICKGIVLTLDADEVERRLKGGKGEKIRALTLEVLEEVKRLIDPKVAWEEYEVKDLGEGQITLEGDWVVCISARLPSRGRVEKIVALAGTIGDELEKWVSELFKKGEALKAAIVDAVGSLHVEVLMERVCERMARYALGCGLRSSHLLSPGMPGIPLEEQPKVVQLAKGLSVGIRTTERGMMTPEKSFCGVVLLGEEVPRVERHAFCARCVFRERCPFRSDVVDGL